VSKSPDYKEARTWPLVGRLVRTFLRPYFPRLALAIVFMAIAAATPAIQSELMQRIVDDVFTKHDQSKLVPVALAVFLVFLARGVSVYINSVTMNDIGQRIVADIQRMTFRHLMFADMAFYHRTPSGELISRMTSDIGMMRTAVAEVLTSMIRSTLTLLFLIYVMFQKDWELALISFSVFPLAGVFVSRLGKRMRRISGSTQAELASFSSLLSEVFQSMRHVKAYGMEGFEVERAGLKIDRLYHLTHRIFRVSAISQPISELLSGLAIVTLVLYGGHEVIAGHRTPGQLFAFITAFLLAYEPLKRAGKLNGVMQTGLASAERVFALIDLEPALKDAPDAVKLELRTPSLKLDRVSFGYGSAREALSDVTIDVPAGKTVALVGPSGAGKSTVLNLIPRFYDVGQGAVMVSGQDVRRVTLESLRGSMALVSQDVALFDDTVMANIRYGREGASDAEVESAARSAAAHEFIMGLPNGYQTMIGENGVTLSGGQRQRLSIARAMLRDAPILLLDEATSALDARSERAVQAALKQLRQGRTTLVIAHRLSTIMDADLIYVMEEGKVVENGTHAELLRRDGLYRRLYGLQSAEDEVVVSL
jgi:subfamily B ATP-binding cassette protein MsbA